jgi:hypothetical protein
MLREKDPLCPQFPFFPVVFSPPEKGMKPEDAKDPDQEGGHQNEGPIEHGLSHRILMGRMGNKLDEIGIGLGMTFSTGLHQTALGDE